MTYGIRDLCERFKVGEHTVLNWIHKGDMRAIDVSRNGSRRPKWRVTQEDLEAFETLRTPATQPPRRRRRKPVTNVKQYF